MIKLTSKQLRAIISRYGAIGVLGVGLYLVIHHLWTVRRGVFLSALFALAVAATLFWPHPRPLTQKPAIKLPKPTAAPPLSQSPVLPGKEKEEPVSDYQPAIPLLSRARKVTALNKNYRTHCWLDSKRLLLVIGDGRKYENTPDCITGWQGSAEYVDLTTGRHHVLSGLTRLLNRIDGTPGLFVPSPDRKWLWWCNWQTPDGWPNPVFARLDGSHYQESGQDKFSQTFWLDNHRWVEQEVRPEEGPLHLNVHDMYHPHSEKHYLLNSPQAQKLLRRGFSPKAHVHDTSVLANTVEIREYLGSDCVAGKECSPLHTRLVRFPKGVQNGGGFISPQEKRILYQFDCRVHLLGKGNLNIKSQPTCVSILWSSRIDGSHLHEIGYVPCDPNREDASYPQRAMDPLLQHAEWLPDGKRIGFLYRGAIYTISVD